MVIDLKALTKAIANLRYDNKYPSKIYVSWRLQAELLSYGNELRLCGAKFVISYRIPDNQLMIENPKFVGKHIHCYNRFVISMDGKIWKAGDRYFEPKII